MKIVLAGSVNSSLCTLQKLIEHDLPPVAVFGLQKADVSMISSYADLEPTAVQAGIPFHAFERINDHTDAICAYEPDVIFVVGLSQLVNQKIIDSASKGCVGFHPTKLPLGRGRAPVAWIVLDQCPAAATFFHISAGIDDGPILSQVPFNTDASDNATTVSAKLIDASKVALDNWLPELRRGVFEGIEQDDSKATYYGKRIDEDGRISWIQSAKSIDTLIRASTRPHPGAFTRSKNIQIRLWAAQITSLPIRAVPGSIVQCEDDGSFVIQTGNGHLIVTDYQPEADWTPTVGARFEHYIGFPLN